ncbi:MAG: T9SS type A sorting domain-containing protein [Ignavibacteria bacterium]|nr:T9SS type A sorting domain-containing protein [Ignavibacteria bacterium]
MRIRSLFFAQIVAVTSVLPQLTINSSDAQKDLGISTTTLRYGSADTSGLGAVLSASGSNKTWILTGRAFTMLESTTGVLLNKSTSGAPSQSTSAFSSANYVMRRRSASKPSFTDWTYLAITTSSMSYCGYASDSAGILKSLQTNVPAQRSRSYPTTYPGSWGWSSTVTSTSYSGSVGVGVGVGMAGSDVIDAYGTVTTPEGSFACLRMKRRTDILFGFFTITSYTYDFVDQNRNIASISAGSTGTVPGGVSYYRQESGTAVSRTDNFLPDEFNLFQNYPNPFNPSTAIQFSIPAESYVTLRIYNSLGAELKTLVASTLQPGSYKTQWNAVGLPSGVYFCRMQAGEFVITKKLVLLR